MKELLEQQRQALHETAWLDQTSERLRIPIDRAIQLVAERGFPDWPEVEAPEATKETSPTRPGPTPGDQEDQPADPPRANRNASEANPSAKEQP